MDKLVSHSSHLFPGNLRMSLPHGKGILLGGFTDNLKGSDHCINRFLVFGKLILGHSGNEFRDILRCFLNIGQIVAEFSCSSHRLTTSLRICSPIKGLSVFFMTKSTLTPNRSDK